MIKENLEMNIHRKGKSGGEISIYRYKNFFENLTFSIQVIEKVAGTGYENGVNGSVMLEYQLQLEDY